jgi:DNA-binding winged helix-turn-helix (wHTH) protein/tetratricopeptide (TPR) repeat protein
VAQQSSTVTSVHFATFDLDLQSGELRKNGLKIRLPRQSFQVLSRLLERPGQPVTREQLRETLWPAGTFVDFEVGLSSVVRKLRDALGDSAENPRFVETLPRVGYRFIAPLNAAPETDRTALGVPSVIAEARSTTDRSTNSTDFGWRRLRARASVAIILVGGASIVALALLIPATRGWLAASIAQKSVRTLSTNQSAHRVSARAEDLFFRAVSAAGRDNLQGFTEAIKYADAATDEQPDFARAWARKAQWWTQFSFAGGLAPLDFMPKAEAAARKALELDESLPEAHLALALVLYRFHWNWTGAEREFRRSLQLDSSGPGHRMLAAFLDAAGHPKEAVEEAQRARDLDPLSAQAHLTLGVVYRDAGQKEQAISEFRSVLRDHPEIARAHFQLALSLLEKGDSNSAVSELQTAVSLSPRASSFLSYVGYTHALTGKTGEAQRILGELERLSRQQFVSPVDLAGIEVSLGLKDAALISLEKACDLRDPALTTLLTDRRMASLRSDSRFQNLLRRVGLPLGTP